MELAATAQRVREIAQQLALTQAAAPDVEDAVGFSNADFPHAFALLASENDAGLARLLLRYARQSGQRDDPEWAAQVRALAISDQDDARRADAEAMFATWQSDAIAADRDALRGRMLWHVEADDSAIYVGGVGVPWELRRTLRAAAEPNTPKAAGAMRLPAERLDRIRMRIVEEHAHCIDRHEAFVDWLKTHVPTHRIENAFDDDAGRAVSVSLTVLRPAIDSDRGAVAVNWKPPFDAEGVAIRELVKTKFGARWDAARKHWLVEAAAAVAFAHVVRDEMPHVQLPMTEIDANPVEIRYWQASAASEQTVVRLVTERRDAIVLSTPRRNDDFVAVMSKVGARWDAGMGGYVMPWPALPEVMQRINDSPTLDGQCLLPSLRAYQVRATRDGANAASAPPAPARPEPKTAADLPLGEEAARSRHLVKDVGFINIANLGAQSPQMVRVALEGWLPARDLRQTPTGWLVKEALTRHGSPTGQMFLMSGFDGRAFVFANATAAGAFAVDHPPSSDAAAMADVLTRAGLPLPATRGADAIVREYPEFFPAASLALDVPIESVAGKTVKPHGGLR